MISHCFTYQHTCSVSQDAHILLHAPFKSGIKKGPNAKLKIPFLGVGYYFWEENITAAIRWGKKHYANKFRIVEYVDVTIKADELLDLTNRRDINYFKELQKAYTEVRPSVAKWPIGTWIEFFKKLKALDELKFPFNYIKADEHLPEREKAEYDKGKAFFAEGLPYFTYLDPLYMLCVIDKKHLNFINKRLL